MSKPDERANQLSTAFREAVNWVESQRRSDRLGGFGRAEEWGAHVITLMPEWFRTWLAVANWHPVGLLQGEDGWWRYVKAFGLTPEQWWQAVDDVNKVKGLNRINSDAN